jgi:putative phosphoesterase
MLRIGLISDTHGLLRPEANAFLRGCDHILHAGDIGGIAILDELAALAPLTVVRGNNDVGTWAAGLEATRTLSLAGVRVHLVHDLALLSIEPSADGVQVVVSGHSHKPRIERRDGVLFVNPGSAGPRRFRLPVSIGELVIDRAGGLAARTVELLASPAGR